MKMHCKFCEKFAGQSSVAWGEATDQVLFESPNFVVVPSLGSILPGWLLIVPRNHFLCVGAMGDGLIHEMRQLRDEAAESLRSQIGPVTYFEHGPVKACTSVGCGIDHAHLHIVSTTTDLVAGTQQIVAQPLSWTPAAGLETAIDYYQRRIPYLYVEVPNVEAWIATGPHIESQVFRKVIAAASGRMDAFDWKCHPFEDNIRRTIGAVESWKSRQEA